MRDKYKKPWKVWLEEAKKEIIEMQNTNHYHNRENEDLSLTAFRDDSIKCYVCDGGYPHLVNTLKIKNEAGLKKFGFKPKADKFESASKAIIDIILYETTDNWHKEIVSKLKFLL